MKYAYGTDINGENLTGIINLETMKVLCICPKENADLILEALNAKKSHIENAANEMYEVLAMLEYSLNKQLENYMANCSISDDEAEKILQALRKARGEQTTQP